ncbi:MAG: algL [Moraxellaceae bacterium]|jgi:poly(beta-D-mannuronate) lyase|nr:algL [Moraxellaceae bacterium]
MMRRNAMAALCLFVLAAPAAAAPLVSPFEGLAVTPKAGKAKACDDIPAPYTGKLEFASKYAGSGKARDRLNPFALFSYKRSIADIEAFEKGLAANSDRHVRGQAGAAACALAWLHAWAAADALAGEANAQGKAVRKWALAAAAFNYLKIRDAKGLDAAELRTVRDWLSRRAEQVVADHSGGDPARMNNHLYWAAAAVAASAVATDRRDLLDWSFGVYRRAAAAIDADGVLATEMARGARALEYHNFALAPLVMVAAIGRANGEDLLALNDCALCRLATRVETGLRDAAWFSERAGSRQALDEVNGKLVPWVAPLAALCPGDARLAAFAQQHAPASARRLGGNLTDLFAHGAGQRLRGDDATCRQLWR